MVRTVRKCERPQPVVGIVDAYEELQPNEFAVWIRLMMFTPEQLRAGRKKVAKRLGFSDHQSNALLRRLKNKGYIELVPGEYPGIPTSVVLTKKALLAGRNHFVRLAAMVHATGQLYDARDEIDLHIIEQLFNDNIQFDQPNSNCLDCVGGNPPVIQAGDAPSIGINDMSGGDLCKTHRTDSTRVENWFPLSFMNLDPENDDRCEKSARKRRKFATLSDGGIYLSPTKKLTNETPLSRKLRQKHNEQKQKAKEQRALRVKNGQLRVSKEKRHKSKFIDWGRVDQKGKPAISFTPSERERRQMLKVLSKPSTDLQRRRLSNKLGAEFLRMYTRYRRQINASSSYTTNPKERKWANAAGEACLYKGITPRQYIEYWHERVGEFTGMTFPSLSFLSSIANADTVACASMDTKSARDRHKKKREDDEFIHKDANTFGRVDELDSRLRHRLEKAGFDTTGYNDRFLMTVQETAKAIAAGFDMFVASDIRPMVVWAAEHVYKGFQII